MMLLKFKRSNNIMHRTIYNPECVIVKNSIWTCEVLLIRENNFKSTRVGFSEH